MLEQIARHGGFSLQLQLHAATCTSTSTTPSRTARWRSARPCATALGDKRGIARYGFLLPMDEAQAQVAIDLSGRPYAVFEGRFGRERVGELPTELVPHFFRSLGETLGAAIHVAVRGENTHHMVEACFKGVGRALRQAIAARGQRAARAARACCERTSVIIDSGGANIASLRFALERLGTARRADRGSRAASRVAPAT